MILQSVGKLPLVRKMVYTVTAVYLKLMTLKLRIKKSYVAVQDMMKFLQLL